jgi:hypothetical protein
MVETRAPVVEAEGITGNKERKNILLHFSSVEKFR